jgi:hypothetical protein
MSNVTISRNESRRRRFFPYELVRLDNVNGATGDDVTIIANSRHQLEIQVGDDWVQFSRSDVLTLVNAFNAFLAFDGKFRERVLRLELSINERRSLDELLRHYDMSEEARRAAHEARDEAENDGDGDGDVSTSGASTSSASDDEVEPAAPAPHHARKPRRRNH